MLKLEENHLIEREQLIAKHDEEVKELQSKFFKMFIEYF